MFVLDSTKTMGYCGKDGIKWFQVELNGGSATLEIKLDGAANFVPFDGSTLADGVFIYTLPKCRLQLTGITGSPVVYVYSD